MTRTPTKTEWERVLEVLLPVTTMVHKAAAVDEVVETVSIELAVPPPRRVMFNGLRLVVGPPIETNAVSRIVPAKLLMLVTLIVDWPEEPWAIVRLPGMADSVKSGAPGTVTVMLTECDKEPLVPLTIMV